MTLPKSLPAYWMPRSYPGFKFLIATACVSLGLLAGFNLGTWVERTYSQVTTSAAPALVLSANGQAFNAPATPPGRWVQSAGISQSTAPSSTDENAEQVLALGYLQGSQKATSRSGVITYDDTRTFDSLNLVLSGHAPEAYIMDMKGHVLHTWAREFKDVWPNRTFNPLIPEFHYWRRVYLYPDGGLLAIFEGHGLIKLDAESKLVWQRPEQYHHDLSVAPDGTIYVLERRPAHRPDISPLPTIEEDFVTRITPDGQIIDSVSLLECMENSPFKPFLAEVYTAQPGLFGARPGDIFHTNTLEVLDGKLAAHLPPFSAGRVLVSFRELSAIAVVDLRKRKIVWMLSGVSRYQHQATMLDNGHMLLFDNLGLKDNSRVVEIDPVTQAVAWIYTGSPSAPLFSMTCGSNQRLPNGNTLITESDNGRVIEVSPDGTIVWEYLNPHRAGKHDNLVATLFEVIRLPHDLPTSWMGKPKPREIASKVPQLPTPVTNYQ